MHSITCVIADDHPAILDALRRALGRAGVEVVGEALDGDEAIQLVEELHPTVALVDVRLGRVSGIDVIRHIGRSSPDTASMLYTRRFGTCASSSSATRSSASTASARDRT